MTSVPLRTGPIEVPGFVVGRSGIRWLCDDGHMCRPGEVIAYCNIGLMRSGSPNAGSPGDEVPPFPEESRDFQVALATPVGGRLRRVEQSSHGGFVDRFVNYQHWTPDFVIGRIEFRPGEKPFGDVTAPLRLLFLAGRRATEMAENRSGLQTGWHDRNRAWWFGPNDGPENPATLLSLGICEQLGIVRGERQSFIELFEATKGPAHVVYVADDLLVPCARVAVEQMLRTPEQLEEIAADLARTMPSGPAVPTSLDWMFAGALLSALGRSPLTDRCEIFTKAGLRIAEAPGAVLLSLQSETPTILRHRRLGYAISCHGFRFADAGPATRAWFESSFDVVSRGPGDNLVDYIELIDAVRALPGRSATEFLILNSVSTSGYEDMRTYSAYDQPLSATLAFVRRKEQNLMLHDLEHARDISIVDADLIAAKLGSSSHIPDGTHQNGRMQAHTRAEVLRILRARGVEGF